MALTKVRPPVTEISLIDSGTTAVTILSAGGNIDIDVAGVSVLDISSTAVTVAPAITLDADLITGESVVLATAAGAGATLDTAATLARLLTTSAHPLELGANNLTGLTIATDAKVELDVEGTAINHLVTKAYVDAVSTSGVQTADIEATTATTGSISIPNDTGNNIIINWGSNGSVANNSVTAVTFDTAFPTALLIGLCCSTTQANHDGTMSVISKLTTGMSVHSSLDKSSGFDWIAIGY